MRAPAFWWKPSPDIVAQLLSPLGAVYGAIAAQRMNKAGARVNAPVICVGNFVAGGAGKTPTALALAQEIISAGHTPFFLSRGYGASRPVERPRIVDATGDRAADVGDEPLLLARVAPVVVCADRVAGARLAIENGATVLIMDDGLQNPALQKDFTIAVVDGAVGVGNGLCIPAGPLRAALDAQLQRTDAVVIVGEGAAGSRVGALAQARGLPVITARLAPEDGIAARLRGQRILAFAGIGRPEKFFETLRTLGAEIADTRAFADHHAYSPQDMAALRERAKRLSALLVTTEKDAARIGEAGDIVTLPVALKSDEDGALAALATRALAGARR